MRRLRPLGFAPITDDEADRLMNYARAAGLKGRAGSPLTRGEMDEWPRWSPSASV
jgi:hypothetical protein